MATLSERLTLDREAQPIVVYSAESRLIHPRSFIRSWVADLRVSSPTAHRFFKRSLAQRYRMSSLGLAWACVPSVITAIVLIAGQRTSFIRGSSGDVPAAFYGVFGLALGQTFLESLNYSRVLFTGHQLLLRRKNVPLEGLILAAFIEVFVNTLVKLVVLAAMFFLFSVTPRLSTLPIALTGLVGVVLAGGGLGLLLAPLSSLRSDLDHVMSLLPWVLFALTPVFIAPAPGSLLDQVYAINPLAWLFDSIRTAAYGARGSLFAAALGPLVGVLLVLIGWFFSRFCRPYVVERYLV